VTPEARLAFVLFFFAVWCFLGLIAWAAAAVIGRGRGALPALPLALAAACAAGVAVPLAGLDDFAGFLISLATAFVAGAIASVVGMRLARKVWPERPPTRLAAHRTAIEQEGEASTLTPDT
jgi:hypothetical protein